MKRENLMDLHDFPSKISVCWILSFHSQLNYISKNDQTLRNLNAMCDVELILGLTCIFPLL